MYCRSGIAGLRYAAILHENEFDVTILEARSRVGGRVHHPLVWSDYWCTSSLAISDTTLLDMPEQSTRISSTYIRWSFCFDFVSTTVFSLKLTSIFLTRGPQWIYTSGNNPILNIAI